MSTPNAAIRKILFWIIALGWLPAGIVLNALARFGLSVFADKGGDGRGFLMFITAICGLFLALACRKLWQQDRKISACICALVLGSISVTGVLFAGLLGPLVMLFSASVISLPAWLLVFIVHWRSMRHGN